MNCPVCKTPMFIIELDGVEVDHCTSCKGIWLDAGELEELMHSAKEKDKLLASFKKVNSNEKSRRCPICRSRMEKIEAGQGNQPVLIDRCKENHGIWFDKGELHEIMEESSGDEKNPVLNLLYEMFSYDLKKKDGDK